MLHYGWATPDIVAGLSNEAVAFLIDALVWAGKIEVKKR